MLHPYPFTDRKPIVDTDDDLTDFDYIFDAVDHAYTSTERVGDFTHAILDALHELQPVVVAQWYAEHHPQPERVYGPPFIERYPQPERDTIGRAVRDSVGDPEYAYRYALDPNKPQPERDTEQQRDAVAHIHAVGYANGYTDGRRCHNLAADDVYPDAYDEHAANPEWIANTYPEEHAAARKRHTDPERD